MVGQGFKDSIGVGVNGGVLLSPPSVVTTFPSVVPPIIPGTLGIVVGFNGVTHGNKTRLPLIHQLNGVSDCLKVSYVTL